MNGTGSSEAPNFPTQLLLVAVALAYVAALLGIVCAAIWYVPPPAALKASAVVLGWVASEALIFGGLRLFDWLNWIEHEIQHTAVAHARGTAAILAILGIGSAALFALPLEKPAPGSGREAPRAVVFAPPINAAPVVSPPLAPFLARPAWLVRLDAARARNAARRVGRRHAR